MHVGTSPDDTYELDSSSSLFSHAAFQIKGGCGRVSSVAQCASCRWGIKRNEETELSAFLCCLMKHGTDSDFNFSNPNYKSDESRLEDVSC